VPTRCEPKSSSAGLAELARVVIAPGQDVDPARHHDGVIDGSGHLDRLDPGNDDRGEAVRGAPVAQLRVRVRTPCRHRQVAPDREAVRPARGDGDHVGEVVHEDRRGVRGGGVVAELARLVLTPREHLMSRGERERVPLPRGDGHDP